MAFCNGPHPRPLSRSGRGEIVLLVRIGDCQVAKHDRVGAVKRGRLLPELHRLFRLPVVEQIAQIVGSAGVARIGLDGCPQHVNRLVLEGEAVVGRHLRGQLVAVGGPLRLVEFLQQNSPSSNRPSAKWPEGFGARQPSLPVRRSRPAIGRRRDTRRPSPRRWPDADSSRRPAFWRRPSCGKLASARPSRARPADRKVARPASRHPGLPRIGPDDAAPRLSA